MTTRAVASAREDVRGVEWTTLGLIIGCYLGWAVALWGLALVSPVLAMLVLALVIALHSSLTHEVIHGHPFRLQGANEALMVLPLNVAIPFQRFRDMHLAHHRDSELTDPYDDPESNYLDAGDWERLPRSVRAILALNNTLAGRVLLGPGLGQIAFMRGDWRAIRAGDRNVARAWGLHMLGAGAVLAFVVASPMPLMPYLIASYLGLGLVRIRTFLEHRAHEKSRARTVIIEDKGLLAFLFLNNNLHVVHHMHPDVAWYDLPALYRARKDHYVAANEGYVYRSYAEIFRQYLWRAKDPVAHPLWRRD